MRGGATRISVYTASLLLAHVHCLLPDPSANNFALKAKRKTLGASDVFSALEDMEFETFIPELKECLEGMGLGLI